MSRKSRALKKAGIGLTDVSTTISKLRGPADVAAVIPYLLGFQPNESLVLVALEGPRKRFGPVLRIDLVDDRRTWELQLRQVLAGVRTNRMRLVIVATFSADATLADSRTDLVLAALAEANVALEDAFRTDGRRWWSYTCHNPMCCSPDGVAYDVGTSRVAAEAVLSGLTFEPDRDALRARFAPVDERTRLTVASEVGRLQRTDPTILPGAASAMLGARVSRLTVQPEELTPSDVAWLALAVQSIRGQGSAFALVERAAAAGHFELWRAVMCRVADELLPPPGCLTAFSAWLDGRGVLASHALDRVFEVAPRHPLAGSLMRLLTEVVDPRRWAEQMRPRPQGGAPPPLAG
jgi:hypothetical protein